MIGNEDSLYDEKEKMFAVTKSFQKVFHYILNLTKFLYNET